MIKLYRKRPVTIKAIYFDGTYKNAMKIEIWAYDKIQPIYELETNTCISLKIKTLEGTIFAKPGDYIIKGVEGEFYPCKESVFKQTYEVINE